MLIRNVGNEEYSRLFPTPRNVFGSEAFIGTVAGRCQAVRRFAGMEANGKARLGIIAGYTGTGWEAPFSAPFTEIAYREVQNPENIYDFISELTTFLGERLELTLPPAFYDVEMLPKLTGVLANYADKAWFDLDYYYPLDRIDSYLDDLDHSARKNLNRAREAGFTFAPCDIARAYEVIRANRESHGYNLAMGLEQLIATSAVVKVDCFVMSLPGSDGSTATDVAAAIVYHVAPGIVQVIYWGDVPGYSAMRPMNIFPYHLFSHYARTGMRIVDVGPSSTRGVPNSGLCRFKESVGCLTALKPTMIFG